uniref:Protein kinase domain-containing protein n=1 Tax=Salix viminalis TaxID=40686 RepID=A0A6N2LVU0_SALVM
MAANHYKRWMDIFPRQKMPQAPFESSWHLDRSSSRSQEKWKPVRFLSSGGALRSASEFLEEEELNSKENEDDLKGRIFRLRLPKRSVTNVIDKWVREGNAVSASELRHISKELRKSQRFKHALERQHNWWVDIALKLKNLCLNVSCEIQMTLKNIVTQVLVVRVRKLGVGANGDALLVNPDSYLRIVMDQFHVPCSRFLEIICISEWMVTHEEFELSDTDHASRIDLMTKVFGVDAAEHYFDSLPLAAKTTETYTALLHSYAAAKLIERAEELMRTSPETPARTHYMSQMEFYKRIKGSNLSFTVLMYNEMMTLYMSVGQLEKVSQVVEELKHQKVALDIFTYNLWISSYAAALNIGQVRRILDEMSQDSGVNDDWKRYIKIANIYVTAGLLVNAESSTVAVVEAAKKITQREWITYDFLVILYAGLGKKDKLDQIWKSLRLTNQKMTRRNYVCILSSYLILGHLKEVGEICLIYPDGVLKEEEKGPRNFAFVWHAPPSINSNFVGDYSRQRKKYKEGEDKEVVGSSRSVVVGRSTIDAATPLGRNKKIEKEYDLGAQIGQGKFGLVVLCRSKVTGEEFACKMLRKGEELVHQEVENMQHLSGRPGVVTLMAVFEDLESFYLVMELCPEGRLLDKMAKEKRQKAREYTPRNFWADDFGLAVRMSNEKWKPVRFLSSGGASRSASEFLEEEELNSKENEDDLKGRIFRLRLPKRSATNVIEKWVREGNAVSASELRHISKELRKSQRFKHALEV